MTLRRLRTLVAVAQTRTFSAAAEKVFITHAAVSQQMQSLEADLGVALFDRSGRTPVLTPLAHQVVAKAERILTDYDTLIPSILNEGGLQGSISIGVMRTTLTGMVPRAVASLRARYPEMGLHVRPGLTAQLLAEIERGHLDAAIVTRPAVRPAGVVFRDLVEEPLALITAPDDTCDDPIALLRSRPFIRFDRTAVVGALIDDWITSNQIKVSEAMELDSPEAISSMVRANLGVSIVPRPAVPSTDPVPVKWVPLGKTAPMRRLVFAHKDNQIKGRALDEIHSALRDVIEAAARA